MIDVTECYFVCEILITDCFNHHYHAYEVRKQEDPIPIVVCRQSDFINHHVLGLYHSRYIFRIGVIEVVFAKKY